MTQTYFSFRTMWSMHSAMPLATVVSGPSARSLTVAIAKYSDWKKEGTPSNCSRIIYLSQSLSILTVDMSKKWCASARTYSQFTSRLLAATA